MQSLTRHHVLLCTQALPGGCSNEEALSRVCMLQNHFCAYQVTRLPLCAMAQNWQPMCARHLADYCIEVLGRLVGHMMTLSWTPPTKLHV